MAKNHKKMSDEDNDNFDNATCCHLCKRKVHQMSKTIVKTNDLVTGKYRGGAHNKCNINYGKKRYLPVLFHILESYDCHYIISEAFKTNQEIRNKRLSAIPHPKE